jgi:hypothetical protein
VSSGTTMVSPGRISIDCERLNQPERSPETDIAVRANDVYALSSAFCVTPPLFAM